MKDIKTLRQYLIQEEQYWLNYFASLSAMRSLTEEELGYVEKLKQFIKLNKDKMKTTEQKIADIKKRQEEIVNDLAELEKEIKREPESLGNITQKWARNNVLSFYVQCDRVDKIVAIRDMIAVADHLNGDWKPDWSNRDELKCCLCDNHPYIGVNVNKSTAISICYFKSAELARQAISILGEEKIRLALS